jgi:hypothetical protein
VKLCCATGDSDKGLGDQQGYFLKLVVVFLLGE